MRRRTRVSGKGAREGREDTPPPFPKSVTGLATYRTETNKTLIHQEYAAVLYWVTGCSHSSETICDIVWKRLLESRLPQQHPSVTGKTETAATSTRRLFPQQYL